jgi:hypothetical protein
MAEGGGLGGAAGLDPVTRRGRHGKPVAAHHLGRGMRRDGSTLTGRRRRRRARSDRMVARTGVLDSDRMIELNGSHYIETYKL